MNTFGQAGITSGGILLGGAAAVSSRALLQFPLYDPRSVRQNRQRFRRDAIESLARANSFYCPAGSWPSRGWILLAKTDYVKLDSYSTTLRLDIGDTRGTDNVAALKNLSIVQAQCVTRGLAADANALYLVEITDGRGVLSNDWFKFPLTAFYNIRVPGYPQTFYPDSMNDYPTAGTGSKTTWTWTTMLKDIWDKMSAFLGAWPGLPYAPTGTPEGFWFPGVPAWAALCDTLEYLGLTVACDLTKAAPFTIVDAGAADAAFTAQQTKYETNLEDDLEWIDTGSGRVPKTIKVIFRRRNSVYGTEETVTYRNDIMAKQWSMVPYYTVTVAAPAMFAKAAGTHFLWSDFTVRYDDSGNPFDADITMAGAIAQERVTQYFNKIYSQTSGFMSQTYAGALPFATGAQVDGVAWTQDYSDQARQGWKTKIVRGPCPPWPEIYK